ncbi:MAG TPA: MFS transporter [Anaeromyxobacter sp.]
MYWALLAGSFVNRVASFVGTFVGLYLVRARGFNEASAAPIVALFGAGALVGAPVGGVLADAIGRRATMLLSFVLGAITVGALGFVSSPPALALLTFLAAGTSYLYVPAWNAAIADVVPSPDRARAWSLSYWTTNVGWIVGVAIGGFLAARSYAALFLADAVTTLLFAAIVLRKVPETRPTGTKVHSPLEGLGLVLRDRTFLVFLLLHLVGLTVFVQFGYALALDMRAHGLGEEPFALVVALNGVVVVVLQPVQAALGMRGDPSRRLAGSALLFGLGYGLNALAGHFAPLPVYVAGMILWSAGEVVGFPYAALLVAEIAPEALRGRYQGAFSMSWALAFTLAPLVGGGLLAGGGPSVLWAACLAAGVLVCAGHLAAGPERRRRLDAARGVPPP